MKRRISIFDGAHERNVFRALQQRWSSQLRLYPQLPLAKLIDLEPSDNLTASDRRYFYATNVDYTFCDLLDRPMFSVEFDGVGRGIVRAGRYSGHAAGDPRRAWKMGFKIKAARAVSYPLVVVSFEEIETLTETESLTVLDAVIGQFLAHRRAHELFEKLQDDYAEEIDECGENGDRDQFQELIEDLWLQAQVIARFEQDPIADAAAKFKHRARELGATNFREEFVYDPPLPDGPDLASFWDPDELAAAPRKIADRWHATQNAERVGCRVVISTPDAPVLQTTWIRNVASEIIEPVEVAANIARYLAFRRAVSLMERAPAFSRR